MRLQGKSIIITGSGSGQGQAAAILFAKEGGRVVVTDVNEVGGQDTADQIKSAGGDAIFVRADVSSAEDCQNLVKAAVTAFGGLDVLYNNAGVWLAGKGDGPVTELDEDMWQKVININLTGMYLVSKYAIPELVKAGGGSIICTSSVAGLNGSFRAHAYGASKGGVIALARSMAMAYGKQNIRVNVICPGAIDTPMTADLFGPSRERAAAAQLIRRLGTATDIANLALYLASDESQWMTGSVITLDGGFTIR
ncbi:MAG TPA: SDR family NAD(P)-dependent oxidoreductase [Dehalococcoidia bacterium]|nr:SDR family NAD(P)-dependent oxidoreductase [Dehalococcoidia bacterium]